MTATTDCPPGYRPQDWDRMSWHHRGKVLTRIARQNRPDDTEEDPVAKAVPTMVKVTPPAAKVNALQTLIEQLDALLTEDAYRGKRSAGVVRYTIKRNADHWTITGLGPDGKGRIVLARDTWADAVATFVRISGRTA